MVNRIAPITYLCMFCDKVFKDPMSRDRHESIEHANEVLETEGLDPEQVGKEMKLIAEVASLKAKLDEIHERLNHIKYEADNGEIYDVQGGINSLLRDYFGIKE